MSTTTRTVRACFEAYLAQDRAAAERLLGADLTFTSPQDDHIDRSTYFERCFPTADRLVSQEIVLLVDATSDSAFVMYEYELTTGARHRNTELITVRDEVITQIEVFFGGRV